MGLAINGAVLAAQMREDIADLLAALPAVRRACDEQGAAALDGVTRAAYRQLRCAQNLGTYTELCAAPLARPFCATAIADCLWRGAAQICRDATFSVRLSPIPLWTAGNSDAFAICLGNLLCNALLYAHEPPQIALNAYKKGENAIFTIRDNGTGILPTRLAHIFEAGTSANPYGDDNKAPGVGLGLAIAQRYAAAYGGRLVVENSYGDGCVFTLCMPCCAPYCAAQATPSFVADRMSALYVQLSPMCDLPL